MKSTRCQIRRLAVVFARGLRDLWLIAGSTVALLVILELAFRGQKLVRHSLNAHTGPGASQAPSIPFDTTRWARDYAADALREGELLWEPYLYTRNPTFRGIAITVDSSGNRVTPVPASSAQRTLRVFFFGGSSTFGWYQRDENTIPALASRRLQAALGDKAHVVPTNLGVPGRTFTQDVLNLMLRLRAGERPHVVVFYDGVNDVFSTVQNGRAGLPQNEVRRADDFSRGRQVAAEQGPGIRSDLKATKRAIRTLVGRLTFVHSLETHLRPVAPARRISVDSAATATVNTFAETARLVEMLGREYNFQPVYVWQPTLLSTRKPLTKTELQFITSLESQPDMRRFRDVHLAVPNLIAIAMQPIAGSRFIDLTDLFRSDSAEVFVDLSGHNYERANPAIVDSVMPELAAAALRTLH